jgi:hypothetical protein
MWMADVLFAAIALWLLARMGAEGSTARGGDARELLDSLTGWVKVRIQMRTERRARRDSL